MDIIIAGLPYTTEEIQADVKAWIRKGNSMENSLGFTAATVQGLIDKIEEQQRVNNNLYRELNRRTTGNEVIQEDGSVEEDDPDGHEEAYDLDDYIANQGRPTFRQED